MSSQCSAVSDQGLVCRKPLFFSPREQEYIDHAGGHLYMTEETENLLDEASSGAVHLDNTALLSGLPASHHRAVDCDKTGFCSWRI